MGKSKRKCRRRGRANPTGEVEGNGEEAADEGSDIGEEHVAAEAKVLGLDGLSSKAIDQPLIYNISETLLELKKQLQYGKVEAKECAFCTLSSILANPESIPLILETNFMRIIAPLMMDKHSATRHSAVGVLRKLSGLDHEICENMISNDVMTPLVALYKTQFPVGWKHGKVPNGKISSDIETFIEATYLLLNLCESSGKAVRIFNRENVLEQLLPCLNSQLYDENIVVAVAYCLQTVSEDNVEVCAVLSEKENEQILNSLFKTEGTSAFAILLKVLSAGMIVNRSCGRLSQEASAEVLRCLSGVLTVNSDQLVLAVAKIMGLTEMDSSVQSLEWILSAQQLSLEIITNMCCSDDEGDQWEEVESSDASDDLCFMDNHVMDCEQAPSQSLVSVPAEFLKEIQSNGLINLVLSKLNSDLDDENFKKFVKTSEGKKINEKLCKVENVSLLCLNNLFGCLDASEIGVQNDLFGAWVQIGKILFQNKSVESAEAATKAMGAIVQKLAEVSSTHFENFSSDDLTRFFELVRSSEEDQLKANVIRVIGTIGCLMGRSLFKCSPNIKMIGTFLLECVARESAIWVCCEAVDMILDVFGDDELNQLIAELAMMEKLRLFLPKLKQKIQKRDLEQHFPFVLTVKTNLIRFIKYKSSTSK